MSGDRPQTGHSAEASAMGFFFQPYFALVALLKSEADEAAIGIELLDDVELETDDRKHLYQLKHSLKANPKNITITSRDLWKTLKVWIDIQPRVRLDSTTFYLVTSGGIDPASRLHDLTDPNKDRTALCTALLDEAERVVAEYEAAKAASETPLPHKERLPACRAFLNLVPPQRLSLLRRIRIEAGAGNLNDIEGQIIDLLRHTVREDRSSVAARLMEWWGRTVIYALTDKRSRYIHRDELLEKLTEIEADVSEIRLTPDFENAGLPDGYTPNSMLARQIKLVGGGVTDKRRAVREEWRAREQRARWANEKLSMNSKIAEHDAALIETWQDKHDQMSEDCHGRCEEDKCREGLKILRWSLNEAEKDVRPIVPEWTAPYYVRGSYQIMSVDLKVGWHPEYRILLGDEECEK